MNFIPVQEEGWHTDDAAALYWRRNARQPDAPTHLECHYHLGYRGILTPYTMRAATADLEFMAAGLFGPPRESGPHDTWTGSHLKFGIYGYQHGIVIVRQDGGGTRCYTDVSLTAKETWEHLSTLPSAMLWNVCQLLVYSYHNGEDIARTEAYQKSLNGQLKKRRRNGRVYVEVITRLKAPQRRVVPH